MSSLDRYLADREEHEITEQRDITLESNPTVDDICSRYEGWLEEMSETWFSLKNYAHGLKYLKGLEYTTQDVTEFSIRLKHYEDAEDFSRAGIFISALINTCPDKEFEIITEHLEMPIGYIGYKNTKQVTVNGNAGDWVGYVMRKGSITVNRDAGNFVGRRMEGGSITVKGNAGDRVGSGIEGGSITVNGDAGDKVGLGMKSGSITVNGDAGKGIGYVMRKGSITVKGDAGNNVGYAMREGSITVKGNAGDEVGDLMKCGSIRIEGEIEGISVYWRGGEIYHKGKRVRPK